MPRAIDIHNHIYPPEYLKYLERRTQHPKIVLPGPNGGKATLWDEGILMGIVDADAHLDPQGRAKFFRECGIDLQVATLSAPGVYRLGRNESGKWARIVNDYYAKLNEKQGGSYCCFMALPLDDVGESVDEIERGVNDLGLCGIGLFTNVNARYIDEPEFHPIFEKAEKYDLPIFVHPAASPATAELMDKQKIPISLWGFPSETTICFTRLVWNGILEKFPKLKLIATHLGGFIPFQFERIDYSFKGFSEKYGYKLPRAPTHYFRKLYYDAVNFHKPAVFGAYLTFGAANLLLGTDYPFPVGDPARAVPNINELPIPAQDKESILRGNALNLLGRK